MEGTAVERSSRLISHEIEHLLFAIVGVLFVVVVVVVVIRGPLLLLLLLITPPAVILDHLLSRILRQLAELGLWSVLLHAKSKRVARIARRCFLAPRDCDKPCQTSAFNPLNNFALSQDTPAASAERKQHHVVW